MSETAVKLIAKAMFQSFESLNIQIFLNCKTIMLLYYSIAPSNTAIYEESKLKLSLCNRIEKVQLPCLIQTSKLRYTTPEVLRWLVREIFFSSLLSKGHVEYITFVILSSDKMIKELKDKHETLFLLFVRWSL